MAQREPDKPPTPIERSERARLDEDGYEYPGPHADVLFGLEPVGAVGREFRRRGFWTKLVGRAPGQHGRRQAGSETV